MRPIPMIAFLAAAALLMAGCASPDSTDDGTPDSNGAGAGSTGTGSTEHPANPYAAPSRTTQVFGSGATFPKPLLESWGIQFSREESKVQVSYGGGGSGKGISDITKKDVFF